MKPSQRRFKAQWRKRLQECDEGSFNPSPIGWQLCRDMTAFLAGDRAAPVSSLRNAFADRSKWRSRFVAHEALATLILLGSRVRPAVARIFAAAPEQDRVLTVAMGMQRAAGTRPSHLVVLGLKDRSRKVREQAVSAAEYTLRKRSFLQLASRLRARETSRRVLARLSWLENLHRLGYHAQHVRGEGEWRVYLTIKSSASGGSDYEAMDYVPDYAVDALGLERVADVIRAAHGGKIQLPIRWRVECMNALRSSSIATTKS